jgi:hypothetical protein
VSVAADGAGGFGFEGASGVEECAAVGDPAFGLVGCGVGVVGFPRAEACVEVVARACAEGAADVAEELGGVESDGAAVCAGACWSACRGGGVDGFEELVEERRQLGHVAREVGGERGPSFPVSCAGGSEVAVDGRSVGGLCAEPSGEFAYAGEVVAVGFAEEVLDGGVVAVEGGQLGVEELVEGGVEAEACGGVGRHGCPQR